MDSAQHNDAKESAAAYQAAEALREVEWRMARKALPRIKVRAARDLVEWIKAEEAEIVETLQQRLSGEIELSVEESYPPGKYTLLEG